MDDRNIRRFERATRVQTFGRAHAADFAPGSKTAELFAALDPIVDTLEQAGAGQLRRHVGKAALIDALTTDFKDIARTSRAIKLDEPDFDDSPYRHPATSRETIVATHADNLLNLLEDDTRPAAEGGDHLAQFAAKMALRAKFLAYELPADFVEDLRSDRDALKACNTVKHTDNLDGVEIPCALDSLLSDAQAIVTRLDAAIQNKYSRNPDNLAAWKRASTTERVAR